MSSFLGSDRWSEVAKSTKTVAPNEMAELARATCVVRYCDLSGRRTTQVLCLTPKMKSPCLSRGDTSQIVNSMRGDKPSIGAKFVDTPALRSLDLDHPLFLASAAAATKEESKKN